MKTQIRLNSVVPDGVSGPEAGLIDLIYSYLLSKHEQAVYTYVSINQISDGGELNEIILKDGNKIYQNIIYKSPAGFGLKTDEEKNKIRLEVIHAGMLRIAEKYRKLDIRKLEDIRDEILENRFSIEIFGKKFVHKKKKDLVATLSVVPATTFFEYYLRIEEAGELKCRVLIYNGMPTIQYSSDLFSKGKWIHDTKVVLSGKLKEIEILINISDCSVEYKNLTVFEKPPHFEAFRRDNSEEDREKARNILEQFIDPRSN